MSPRGEASATFKHGLHCKTRFSNDQPERMAREADELVSSEDLYGLSDHIASADADLKGLYRQLRDGEAGEAWKRELMARWRDLKLAIAAHDAEAEGKALTGLDKVIAAGAQDVAIRAEIREGLKTAGRLRREHAQVLRQQHDIIVRRDLAILMAQTVHIIRTEAREAIQEVAKALSDAAAKGEALDGALVDSTVEGVWDKRMITGLGRKLDATVPKPAVN